MKVSIYQAKRRDAQKKQAVALYKQGLSFRKVSKVLGMSHQWVFGVVREKLSPEMV